MIGTNAQMSRAQSHYDNQTPDDRDDPEMDCPECGETVELEDTGRFSIKLTGTCEKCGEECKYDEDQF